MPASAFRAGLESIVLVFAAVLVAVPASAGSDDNVLANQIGDDPTQPLGKIELLDRFTTTPGPGAAEGTSKQVDTNTPFARIEAPFRIAPQWSRSRSSRPTR
jgi:hypothetical protein